MLCVLMCVSSMKLMKKDVFDVGTLMKQCLKVVESMKVDESVFDDVCSKIDIEMYMFWWWELMKGCLMFVWTGPQDDGSFEVDE